MAAIHFATVRMASRLGATTSRVNAESYERSLNRLARTFVAQMQGLKRYRSRGEQRVFVERVTVNESGQMAFTASPVDPVVSVPTADLSPDVTSFWCSVAVVWPVATPVSAEIMVGSSLSNSCLQSANADPESLRVPHVRFEPKISGRFPARITRQSCISSHEEAGDRCLIPRTPHRPLI